MKRKTFKWVAYFACTGLVIGGVVFYFLIPKLMVEIRNPTTHVSKESRELQYELIGGKIPGKPIEFYSKDSLIQSAYLTYSLTDSTKGTVILVHGIRGRKEHFIGLSKSLAGNGYNSVLVDLRAHGQSDGRYCTFGVKEKWDIKALVDELKELDESGKEKIGVIGIWGQSLGGAVALQALSIDQRIKYGIIESTFSDFESIAHDYLNYFMWYSFKQMSKYIVYRAGKIANFSPESASPINACNQIYQPVFMAHGDNDKKINIKYGKANFKALKAKNKKFVTVPGASHISVWQKGGEDYFREVFRFIDTVNEFKTLN